jgi:regulator of nucleoside diphosphate kinase
MSKRTIYVTETDMDRLRSLITAVQNADDRDRPYLSALESELEHATVVAPEEIAPDVVTMNSRVRLRDGRSSWIMTLVFPESADPEEGRISVLAPLGAALLGCRVGQRVEFRVPGGEARSCDILSVLYQPEAAGHRSL